DGRLPAPHTNSRSSAECLWRPAACEMGQGRRLGRAVMDDQALLQRPLVDRLQLRKARAQHPRLLAPQQAESAALRAAGRCPAPMSHNHPPLWLALGGGGTDKGRAISPRKWSRKRSHRWQARGCVVLDFLRRLTAEKRDT